MSKDVPSDLIGLAHPDFQEDPQDGGPSMYVGSLTKQEFKKECDINHIMSSLAKANGISLDLVPKYLNLPTPDQYGSSIDTLDYQSACNLAIQAQDSFDNLPSDIRTRFNNRPDLFLDFFNDPANQAEAIELGLIPRDLPRTEESPEVPTTTETA